MQIAEEGGMQPCCPGCVMVRWRQSVILVPLGVSSSGASSWARGSLFLSSLATAPFLVAVVPFLSIAVALPSLSLSLSWSSSSLSLSSSSWVVIHIPVPVSTLRALRVLAAAVGGAEGGSHCGPRSSLSFTIAIPDAQVFPTVFLWLSPSSHLPLPCKPLLAVAVLGAGCWVVLSWVAGPSSLLSCHHPLHCHCCRHALAGCPPLPCCPHHHPGCPRRCSPCC